MTICAFISGTTYRTLIHRLGKQKPRTTKELLDITTDEVASEEAVNAMFPPKKAKGKAKREEDQGDNGNASVRRESRNNKRAVR